MPTAPSVRRPSLDSPRPPRKPHAQPHPPYIFWLVIQPYHQAGAVVAIRQFTNNAMNHHHGMQSEERFGLGIDADGDGMANELTVADITAISMFQAAMAVPGRVISNDPVVANAIRD